jgi:hypothetical protein
LGSQWPLASSTSYDADSSSEPGCARDQKKPCSDDDGPDGSRDALTSQCETFDGDGCRHDSHRAKVHDPDDQEDRQQTGTAAAAVESEAQAAIFVRGRSVLVGQYQGPARTARFFLNQQYLARAADHKLRRGRAIS